MSSDNVFSDPSGRRLFSWTTAQEHSPEVVEYLGCEMLTTMDGSIRMYISKDSWTRKMIKEDTLIEAGSKWRSITWVKPNRYNLNHKLEFMNVEDLDYDGVDVCAEFSQ